MVLENTDCSSDRPRCQEEFFCNIHFSKCIKGGERRGRGSNKESEETHHAFNELDGGL